MSRPLAGRALWLATVAGLALAPVMASAQTTESSETPGFVRLGRITFFATRLPRPVLEVPATVTVIDNEQIERQNVNDMQQLVRYLPGVTADRQVSTTTPFGDLGGFTIRGAGGNRVMMLVDGARVPEQITDGSRDYLDFGLTRQAEVIRGPSAVLWGSDALGGVVALRTVQPDDVLDGRDQGGTIRLGYDSFNRSGSGAVTFAQRFSDSLTGVFGLSRVGAHEARLSNAAEADARLGIACPRNPAIGQPSCSEFNPLDTTTTRGIARLEWTPLEGHQFNFSVDRLYREATLQNLMARSATIQNEERTRETSRTRVAVEHIWTPDNGVVDQLRSTLSFSPNRMHTEYWRRLSTGMSQDWLTYEEEFLELDIQGSRSFSTGRVDHELTFGLDADRTSTDYERVTRTFPTSGTPTETRAGGFNFANATTQRADLYIQDRMTIGALEITPGLRYATFTTTPRPNADYDTGHAALLRERSARELVAALALRWQINDNWSVWGNVGEGFKMPTAQQLYSSLDWSSLGMNIIPNPDLLPEEVLSYEIGVRGEFSRGFISVSAYAADYTNFIRSNEMVAAGTYQTINVAERETWGIELAGEWQLRDTLTLNGSLNWQQAREAATAGAPFLWANAMRPVTGTLGVSWELPQYALTLDFVSRFASGVNRTTSATGFRPDGYALLDLNGSWQFNESTSVNFGVQNVFDTLYYQSSAIGMSTTPSTSVASSNPLALHTGPGRTFNVSMNTRF